MDLSPQHRKSLRLSTYDYSQPGAYFVTICTEGRAMLLGALVDDEIVLADAGRAIHDRWRRLPRKFRDVELGEFVVMPNHLHGVVWIVERNEQASDRSQLPSIIDWFKTMSTNEYIRGVRNRGWTRFSGRLWQRSYHERVIRDERELAAISKYIIENPLKWALDRENPDVVRAR